MTLRMTDMENTANGFNWRRVSRHPALMEYRRLALLVALVNLWCVYVLWPQVMLADGSMNLAPLSNMALANFALGIVMRQQRLVNFLFWAATRVPTSWPLWIRWGAGKVFHFGGLHSGGNVAGSLWFTALLGGMVWNRAHGASLPSDLTLGLSGVMVALMVAMIGTAIGPIRAKYHDTFEQTHRFAGWTLLALLWAQSVSLAFDTGTPLLQTPAVWILSVLTLSIASPWMTLKKVKVEADKLSNHAVALKFDYGDTPFAGSSNSISLSPLREWHSFANIPTPNQTGYRLVVSRAGDWTGALIDNPPSHIWVRGITTSGVARIERLFRKVVYVGTGSGIGPILPHLLADDVPSRLIWATRSPRKTYGDALVDEIIANTENPVIWDTDAHGKPDLSQLALQAVRDFDAEAVIVISNQKLTRRVVYDLESQGIPAYGAIWDS